MLRFIVDAIAIASVYDSSISLLFNLCWYVLKETDFNDFSIVQIYVWD